MEGGGGKMVIESKVVDNIKETVFSRHNRAAAPTNSATVTARTRSSQGPARRNYNMGWGGV